MDQPVEPYTAALERASRLASLAHRGQVRRASGVPYVQHVTGVTLILARLGYESDVLVAALLHDVVEDTGIGLDEIEAAFGDRVARLVAALSERKRDETGRERSWDERKAEHLATLAAAPADARAIALADKLHNLMSILVDLQDGRPVWSSFHADRERVLWYYQNMILCCAYGDDPRLERLAGGCRQLLQEISSLIPE